MIAERVKNDMNRHDLGHRGRGVWQLSEKVVYADLGRNRSFDPLLWYNRRPKEVRCDCPSGVV